MFSTSFGDLAHYSFLRTRNASLKSQMTTLSKEVVTGRTTDPTARLGGDLTYLSGVEHTLNKLDSYQTTVSEVRTFANSAQTRMEQIRDIALENRDVILGLPDQINTVNVAGVGQDAREDLDVVIGSLNGNVGGRSIFAGTGTDGPALNDADTLMTALVAEVSALVSSTDIKTAVDNWFNDPAGFDAVMYTGSPDLMAPIEISDHQAVQVSVLATDDAFKSTIKGLALAALTEEAGLSLSDTTSLSLVKMSGAELTSSNDKMIQRQADIGFMESRIESISVRNISEITSLNIAKNKMLEVDPYESQSKLEEVQTQLELLFQVTARSFDLSLQRYI
ncbi:flagellar hook-associated protein 3 FlgL [Epibacterium ulvae]|uniref:Flagellar hook-associated protein 3 FlgL n=2 Tax=Epibacterium ulvae TaxID=1156985 RepID=A0A1G5RKZ7_9RHOB|nr:flagellin [Epibacterium ulvae]SCZ74061.1 flagellar hook-associated protein 3 FlgL [Epibacterium ulvae]